LGREVEIGRFSVKAIGEGFNTSRSKFLSFEERRDTIL